MVWSSNPREQKPVNVVSPANFIDYRDGVRELADLEGFMSFVSSNQLTTDEGPEQVLVVNAGLQIFDVLERSALLGRTFAPEISTPSSSRRLLAAAVRRRPGHRRARADDRGRPRTVIGVMPDDFVFPYGTMLGPDGFTTRTGVDVWSAWIPERDPSPTAAASW